MTVTEKKELTRYLKHGDKKMICKMAGVHVTVMHSWITGRLKTSSIEPFVIELANQRKKEFELQTGTTDQDPSSYSLVLQNISLREDLKSSNRHLRTYQKLVSGKNRIYNQLFLKLTELILESDISNFHKTAILDKLAEFQSDFSFIKRYKRYAEILSSVNPILSRSLERLQADMTEYEKQILSLIKLNLTIHEIAIILAVSDQAVEAEMKLLKFKLKLKRNESLNDFVNSL